MVNNVLSINISMLKEHPENKKLLPPLSEDAKERLKTRLSKDLEPIPFAVMQENGEYIVLDGNNRLEMLREIGYKGELPCIDKGQMTIEEQRTYIEDTALAHRDLDEKSRADIAKRQVARGVSQVEVGKKVGRSQQWVSKETGEIKKERQEAKKEAIKECQAAGMTQQKTAEVVGIPQQTISRITQNTTNGKMGKPESPQKQAAVTKEVKSMLTEEAVLARVEEKKAKAKPVFNETNDNIEWAKYTWNPVVGCKHGCSYCYARDIAERFNPEQPFTEPVFHKDRLTAPENTPFPKDGINKVFVCSMADLFGEWVSDEWICDVLQVVEENPKWGFIFLTKNPSRLSGITWPKNAWVGTTVDCQARVKPAEEAMKKVIATVKFFSCEPLREEVVFSDLSCVDWLIVGGQSKSNREPARQPAWEWVENLLGQARVAGTKIYFKPNLTVRPKEYPKI